MRNYRTNDPTPSTNKLQGQKRREGEQTGQKRLKKNTYLH